MRSALFAAGLLVAALAPAAVSAQDSLVSDGEMIYFNNCAICHGLDLQNSGKTFDLRKLKADDKGRFLSSVMNGKREMPPWRDVLEPEQIDAIWAYIRANAYEK